MNLTTSHTPGAVVLSHPGCSTCGARLGAKHVAPPDPAKMRAALEDMRANGLRFDLNPTMAWSGATVAEQVSSIGMAYLEYIRRMDERAKEFASDALGYPPPSEGTQEPK